MANEDFKYSITIKKYTGNDEIVEIPAEINGLPIIRIGKASFDKCENLQRVYINISNWSKEELKTIFRYAEILPLE